MTGHKKKIICWWLKEGDGEGFVDGITVDLVGRRRQEVAEIGSARYGKLA